MSMAVRKGAAARPAREPAATSASSSRHTAGPGPEPGAGKAAAAAGEGAAKMWGCRGEALLPRTLALGPGEAVLSARRRKLRLSGGGRGGRARGGARRAAAGRRSSQHKSSSSMAEPGLCTDGERAGYCTVYTP
jgi:hypothetical protein